MDLTKIGLTKNESKAFEILIKLGKASASEIAKGSGISAGRIYDVLGSLEFKGLIKVIPEKTKKFIPSDPEILKQIIKKRKEELNEIEKKVNQLKVFYAFKEKEPVEIAKGKRNFYRIERELPKPRKLEYNIKYTAEYRPTWEREYREYLKKGIEIKELVRIDKETIKDVKKWLKVHKKIKEISNEGVAISIRDDAAILISLIKSNIIVLIRDKPFVKLMRELFEKYYSQAKKIEMK